LRQAYQEVKKQLVVPIQEMKKTEGVSTLVDWKDRQKETGVKSPSVRQ
jgi:hypothetical protein